MIWSMRGCVLIEDGTRNWRQHPAIELSGCDLCQRGELVPLQAARRGIVPTARLRSFSWLFEQRPVRRSQQQN
jgi:hypothetical protein